MPYRKTPLVTEEIYHIYTKSIAGYEVFNNNRDYERMMETISFYIRENIPCKFYLKQKKPNKLSQSQATNSSNKLVNLLSYCLMPTHLHLVLKQLTANGITDFMGYILKSYSRYFNIKYKRKGPLWESRFKNLIIESDNQFLHLSRYIHLNPTSASLVDNPEDWKYSSYKEYLNTCEKDEKICNHYDYIDMAPDVYKKFVSDRKDYQRTLSYIKNMTLE